MILTEPLGPDTLAVNVSGTVGAADVGRTFDVIHAMPGDAKVNLLITVADDLAPAWREALAAEWHRRSEVVSLVRRAGRIAVVAPQAWIRIAARVESALMPGLHYEVFAPEQAAAARAHVMGSLGD